MEINDVVAFLILGEDNSVFCNLNEKLNEFTRQKQCVLNICCNAEKLDNFIQKLRHNTVKPLNNCIIIDGEVESNRLQDLIMALKNSLAFRSLPIIVLASREDAAIIDFSYRNYVSAVINKPAQEPELLQAFENIISYWIEIAKLPPFAVQRTNAAFFNS